MSHDAAALNIVILFWDYSQFIGSHLLIIVRNVIIMYTI